MPWKVCSCALVFNFVRLLPIGDNAKCRSPKKRQKLGFSPTEGDRINRSRRNLAHKRIPWVCYSTQHLALIGNNNNNTNICNARSVSKHTESEAQKGVKGGRYRSPQNVKICPKLLFLATGSRHNEHIQMKFGMTV